MHNPLSTSIMDPSTIHGPTAQKMVLQQLDRFWTFNCFDDFHKLRMNLGLKPVPLEAPWNYLSIHIKSIQIDSVCGLGVDFGAGCSWTPRWTRTWVSLGLHLGDSNRINLGAPSWFGHPRWPCRTPCHSPTMIVSMDVMSSSIMLKPNNLIESLKISLRTFISNM